jgi:dipeptidyl aminopeptidase/acylaminoacyl peptidase
MSRLFVALLLALPASGSPWPDLRVPPSRQPAREHAITLDDYATLAIITELAVSPDGKHVAYCEGRWDKTDDLRKTDLWIVATDGKGKPTRLTGDRANDRHPKWSHDGKAIYVLANRKREAETKPSFDGKTQVWRVPLDGGEARAVTKVEGGISSFDYSPKADALFYSVDTDTTDKDDFSALRSKYKAEYGHGTRKVSEVHRLDLQSWRTEKLIAEGRYVREFAVTQDGKRIAMVSCIDDTVIKSEGESRVDIWEDGKVVTPPTDVYRAKAASPHAWLESLAWNPDGTRLAFCAIFDAYPAELIVAMLSGNKWRTERLDRPGERHIFGYGSPLRWRTQDTLVFLAEDWGAVQLHASKEVGPEGTTVLAGSGFVNFDLGPDGTVAFIEGGENVLPGLHFYKDTSLTHLVAPNPQSRCWRLPITHRLIWLDDKADRIQGIIELPSDYKKGDKLPLVVGLHGGPTTSTKAELSYDPHNGRLYFAAHGYAAFFPNYRGSTGYGDKFVTDLIGRENDIEVKDILAGIQHLIKEGIADPDRIGVMGWSNGGYLTNCLIALKDSPVKFKAASSGAGIMDTEAQWGFNDEPAYMAVFKKGLPWEVPEAYRKASPIYGLGNVTTPTLIHVGGNDERCPPGHSKMLYRALKEYRKVPTELVVYPNQPHGLTKLSNRLAKMEWDLAWFDKYVKGKN